MSTPGEVIGSPSSTVGRSGRPTASSVDAGAAHGELKELVEVARHAPLEGEASQQRVLRRVALRHADDPRAEPLEGGVASRPRGEEGGGLERVEGGERRAVRRRDCELGGKKLGSGCGDPSCADPDAPVANIDRVATVAQCDARFVELHNNSYYSPHGNASFSCGGQGGGDLLLPEVQALGIEQSSTFEQIPDDDVILGWARAFVQSALH